MPPAAPPLARPHRCALLQFALTQCLVWRNFNSVICAVSLSQVVYVLCALHTLPTNQKQQLSRQPNWSLATQPNIQSAQRLCMLTLHLAQSNKRRQTNKLH